MKKYFFFAAAAIAISSCTQQEVVDEPKGTTIGFDTFVGKSTRADYTTANLESFYVYGAYSENSGSAQTAFDGDEVSNSGGTWSYSPLRYWVDGATYKFGAVAPATEATFSYDDNTLEISYTVEDGLEDLIVAGQASTITGSKTSNEKVSFAFTHALSKVQFTFVSEWNENITAQITDISLSGVQNAGTTTVALATVGADNAPTWTGQTGTESYDYEDVEDLEGQEQSTVSLNLLPQTITNETVTLTFSVEIDAWEDAKKENIQVSLSGTTWEANKVYNYTLKLNSQNVFELLPIEFDNITVNAWGESTETDLTPQNDAYTVGE